MISTLDHPTQEQTAHTDFAESLKQAVIEQTDNGSRIIRSIVSIMEGDAPNCTPGTSSKPPSSYASSASATPRPPTLCPLSHINPSFPRRACP